MKNFVKSGWKKQGLAVTGDSKSRMEGGKLNCVKVEYPTI